MAKRFCRFTSQGPSRFAAREFHSPLFLESLQSFAAEGFLSTLNDMAIGPRLGIELNFANVGAVSHNELDAGCHRTNVGPFRSTASVVRVAICHGSRRSQ
jgi:hypothetical protein